MTKAYYDMVAAEPSGDEAIDADIRFHRSILQAAHNALILQMGGLIGVGLLVSFRNFQPVVRRIPAAAQAGARCDRKPRSEARTRHDGSSAGCDLQLSRTRTRRLDREEQIAGIGLFPDADPAAATHAGFRVSASRVLLGNAAFMTRGAAAQTCSLQCSMNRPSRNPVGCMVILCLQITKQKTDQGMGGIINA